MKNAQRKQRGLYPNNGGDSRCKGDVEIRAVKHRTYGRRLAYRGGQWVEVERGGTVKVETVWTSYVDGIDGVRHVATGERAADALCDQMGTAADVVTLADGSAVAEWRW